MIIQRKIGPRGQIVLPKDARDSLGLKVGDEICIEVDHDTIMIRPARVHDDYLKSFLDTPKKLQKEVDLQKIIEHEYDRE